MAGVPKSRRKASGRTRKGNGRFGRKVSRPKRGK